MKTLEEKEIIIRARADDQTAFNLLFNSYWDPVLSFLNDRTSNSTLSEELAIETFAKAFDKNDGHGIGIRFRTDHVPRF